MTKRLRTTTTRALFLALVALIAVFAFSLWGGDVTRAQDDDPQAQLAIALVSASPEFADFLAEYPNWSAGAEQEDGNWWYVEFWDETTDEWLGDATVNIETGEISESFVPRPLSAEEYAEWQARVRQYALTNLEVVAVLGDPEAWDVWVDYDRFDAQWYVEFTRGLDRYIAIVLVETDDGGRQTIYLDEFFDANEMDAEERERANRDAAVALAYEAEGVDEALDGYDDWTTYVEPMEENIYSVEFVAGGQELFHAVVNIAENTILESTP